MAITNNDVRFLLYSKKLGASFEHTLTLGRLNFYGTKEYLKEQMVYFKNTASRSEETEFKDGYSEPLFKLLGASAVDSMDFSDYEKATLIHDLNLPVPENLHRQFSAVVDGGTIEHIFNFPQAITNSMKMLRTGGHYIGITPVNNLMGHGFYQFSPELYYRIFSPENGFKVNKMIITACDEAGNFDNWYEVSDPLTAKSRVVLCNHLPTYIMVIAKKLEDKEIFSKPPQQSDYSYTWSVSSSSVSGAKETSPLKTVYNKLIPARIRDVMYAARQAWVVKKTTTKNLGAVNEEHFRKIDEL